MPHMKPQSHKQSKTEFQATIKNVIHNMSSKTICFFLQIESPMWAPTAVITPSGTFEYPLKEIKYNYPNGSAFQYEATAVRNYLKSGRFAFPAPNSLISLCAFHCLILTHLSLETPKGQ